MDSALEVLSGKACEAVYYVQKTKHLQLASAVPLPLCLSTVKSPFINVEEKIDKVVGRRTATPDALKSGMRLQSLAVELHRSLKHH